MASGTQAAKVFISYRREDSAHAVHAIYEKLVAHYGLDSVLYDVDAIPLGVDFVDYLNDQVSRCEALLTVIGDRWVDIRSESGERRLDDPNDFVRIEIQAALERRIRVIRGGGWRFIALHVRSAARGTSEPGNRSHHIGFRCARSSGRQVKPREAIKKTEPEA